MDQALVHPCNPAAENYSKDMNAKLVEMPERRIVSSNTFERKVPAASNSFKDIIEAFDEALGHVIKSIVISTLTYQPAS